MTSIMKDSQCGTYNYMAPEAIKSASPVGANQEYKVYLVYHSVLVQPKNDLKFYTID